MNSDPADLHHRLTEHGEVEHPKQHAIDSLLTTAHMHGVSDQELLDYLQQRSIGEAGTVQKPKTTAEPQAESSKAALPKSSLHLDTSTVLFYIGGILLSVGILYGIYSQEGAMDAPMNAGLLGVAGVCFWVLARMLLKRSTYNVQNAYTGLGDSATLVGSILYCAAAYQSLIISSEYFTQTRMFLAFLTLWLFTLALLHYVFDLIVRRILPISIAALLNIGAFYSVLWILFVDTLSTTIYTVMVVLAGVYFIATGRLFALGDGERRDLSKPFYSAGGFIILAALYSLTVTGANEIAWTLAYPLILYGAFIISIRSKSKTFLTTGSLHLIVFVTTIIFKYFAGGLGPAVAFMVAAVAITGSALFSLFLRKKYFP